MEVETFSWAGQVVTIQTDEDSESPREWSCLGVMVTFGFPRSFSFDRVATEGELEAVRGGGWEGLKRHLQRGEGATVVLPISAMDHSGVTVWVGNGAAASDPGGWDSGLAGFIFDTKAAREEIGTPLDLIEECLRGEVETFNQWLQGEVYGYEIGSQGIDDSCWGFYGLDDVRAQARAAAEGRANAESQLAARELEMVGYLIG